jgi:hypothetical protein
MHMLPYYPIENRIPCTGKEEGKEGMREGGVSDCVEHCRVT